MGQSENRAEDPMALTGSTSKALSWDLNRVKADVEHEGDKRHAEVMTSMDYSSHWSWKSELGN